MRYIVTSTLVRFVKVLFQKLLLQGQKPLDTSNGVKMVFICEHFITE